MNDTTGQTFETAVFGGGCFWCTEAVFTMLKGVKSVTPGYSGGVKENPTYEEMHGGATGHAEVVKIEYEPDTISFRDLLTVFFGSHNPTTRNRQGNDVGPEYRSAIFYTTPTQKEVADRFITEINASNPDGARIVTEVAPLTKFYEAEGYHKNYFAKNQDNPYCEIVINPKLQKVKKKFAQLLKNNAE